MNYSLRHPKVLSAWCVVTRAALVSRRRKRKVSRFTLSDMIEYCRRRGRSEKRVVVG